MRKHKFSKRAATVQRSLVLIICALILTSIANAPLALASTTEFKYDPAGNLVQDKSHKYEYDGFNQLRRILDTTGKPLEEYWYNDGGQRIKKVRHNEDGTQETSYYLGKGFQRTISAEGTKDTVYVYLGGQLVAKKENGEASYYHPDNLGSTSLVTDSKGEVVEKTSYLPFGGVDEGGLESERLYTGKELDSTGMVYFGARYYSPELARFIQPDTIQPDIYDPQQLNRYAYARNNPYKYVDPDGHVAFLVPLLYIAATFIIASVTAALTTYLPATVAIAYDNIQNYGAAKGTAATAGDIIIGGAAWEAVSAVAAKAIRPVLGLAAKKTGSALRGVFTSAERMMASKTGAVGGGANNVDSGRDIVGSTHSSIKPMQSKIYPEVVEDYMNKIKKGEEIAPIEVIDNEGYGMYIDNGHHRYTAYKKLGVPDSSIPMKVEHIRDPFRVGFEDWSNTRYLKDELTG